jgi:hypothetical protein
MEDYLKLANGLRTRMWRTAGARFLASQRLSRRERLSTFTIALLSVVAIGVGLVDPTAGNVAEPRLPGLSAAAVTAIISVFVLVISVLEGGSRAQIRAEKLHENAVGIGELRSQLEALVARSNAEATADWDELAELRESYDTQLRECPFNHEPIDDRQFMVNHRLSPEFSSIDGKPQISWPHAQGIKLLYQSNSAWLSVTSSIIVISLVLFAFRWDPSKLDATPRMDHTEVESSRSTAGKH